MTKRGSRTIGRIQVLQLFAEPLEEEPSIDGGRLERRLVDGTVELLAIDDSGILLGVARIHPECHGDSFYGRYSRNDENYIYGSGLEIEPAARGRGLGKQLTHAARCAAFDFGGRGVKSLVAPDNAVSLRCHEATGFDPPAALLRGVRLGDRVLWFGGPRPV